MPPAPRTATAIAIEPDPTTCTPTGAPWPPTDQGSGHLWPVLGGERGEYNVAAGNRAGATQLLNAMAGMTSGGYLEPEQAWEDPAVAPSPFGTDPATASIGFSPGHPAGSASPLTWAQSQYARLALAIGAGRDLETPQVVKDRYVTHGMPGTLPITIGSPADGSNVDRLDRQRQRHDDRGCPRRRRGRTADRRRGRRSASATADGNGNWSLSLPVSFGTTKITATATSRAQHRLRPGVRHQRDAAGHERARPSPTRPATTTDPGHTNIRQRRLPAGRV